MSFPKTRHPVGIFDSGFGGLTVFKEIERRCPSETLLYFGDTARLPYGTKSPETVTRYALQVLSFFETQGIKLLVVACNTVSAVALPVLRQRSAVPIVGVAEPGARRAAGASRNRRIGVIGTEATISSGTYEKLIHALDPTATVISAACPLFVPLVEEGWVECDIADRVVERYLSPLGHCGIDTLVLGCTHYPLLKEAIGRFLGPEIMLVDSAEETAMDVHRLLREHSIESSGDLSIRSEFFVTDSSEKFQALGSLFMGRAIEKVHHIDL